MSYNIFRLEVLNLNKVIYANKEKCKFFNLDQYPNAGPNPNIAGMRKIYGENAFLVKSGRYLYNVPEEVYRSIISY